MIHFIANPNSRSGKSFGILEKVKSILDERHIVYQLHLTEYAGHAIALARDITANASENNPVTLVIIGGDGTIDEVYNGLLNNKYVTLGYISSGSGNDFARGMGISKSPEVALSRILDGKNIRKIEYGTAHAVGSEENMHGRGNHDFISPHKFAVSCGIGYDAGVIERSLDSKLKNFLNKIGLGRIVYTLFGIIQIILNPKTSAEVYIDDKLALKTDRFHFASVHTLKYEGGGFPFASNADPSDGLLSVCVFHGTGKLGFTLNLACSIFEKHAKRKGVSLFQCKTCTVKTDKNNYAHTDGEYFGFIKELHASVCSFDDFINIII